MLAPVHRSMHGKNSDRRESERREWWKPRMTGVAEFVREELGHSDIVLLQEWWFHDEFTELFDDITGSVFHRGTMSYRLTTGTLVSSSVLYARVC
eukprot:scaffold356530_cov59-Attheya_sp.AAC.1